MKLTDQVITCGTGEATRSHETASQAHDEQPSPVVPFPSSHASTPPAFPVLPLPHRLSFALQVALPYPPIPRQVRPQVCPVVLYENAETVPEPHNHEVPVVVLSPLLFASYI